MQSLLSVNVNDRLEKKNGLSYLSWAWAWAEVLKIDPSATWEVVTYGHGIDTTPYMRIGETAMVHTFVTINGLRRDCMLPVMDHRNKAIVKPDAFAINTAIMRCMTKAISMHGLGLYVFAGEDVPQQADPAEEAERERLANRGHELDTLAGDMVAMYKEGQELAVIRIWHDPQTWSADLGECNEEKKYVWSVLEEHSKLRSLLKANKPKTQAA
jgi:hypothetical protein